MRTSMKGAVAALAVSSLCSGVHGQEVSEKVLKSIQTPNEIETSIGTLRLRLGKTNPHFAERRRYRTVAKSSRAPRGLRVAGSSSPHAVAAIRDLLTR